MGVWTIGYGHTKGVKAGDSITQEQAEAFLLDDAQDAAGGVLVAAEVPLTDGTAKQILAHDERWAALCKAR